MSGDKITKIEVIKEYLSRNKDLNEDDIITTLLPTCPFRTKNHIIDAFKLFNENPWLPFLIGVTEYEFPIQLALECNSQNTMKMVFEDGYITTRSQNIEKKYHPNGAIYIAKIGSFLKTGTFFNSEMLTYKMTPIHSFDIDYPYQFEIAEILAKKIAANEL